MTARDPERRLSDRQLQVLSFVSHGLTGPEIAEAMVIEQTTVRNHVHSMLIALEASDRAHAVRIGFEDGLLKPATVRRPRRPRRTGVA